MVTFPFGSILRFPSLEINDEPTKLLARAKVTKIGKSIGFLSSELFQNDKLIASATCTAKMADINKKYLKQMKDTVRK